MLESNTTGGIRLLTLACPERGNALSAPLVDALLDAVDDAYASADVHTLVLQSHGANFCTGFDLSNLESQSDGDLLLRFVRIETLLAQLWHAPIRTAAYARGRAWGAGADLFTVCDVRVTEADATFRFPGAAFGLVLGTRRLAERIGTDTARRCVIDGTTLAATQAKDVGLVTDIVPPGSDLVASFARPVTDRGTMALLHSVVRPDHREDDLAALVESATKPGLKERIAHYVQQQKITHRRAG